MKKKNTHLRKSYQHRKDLIGEHAYSDIGQLILLFLFMAIWISDTFIYRYSIFLNQFISNYIRIPIALILFIIAGILSSKGLKTVFGEKREKPKVITTGVFAIVRHPIYLASIFTYLGLILLSISLLSILIWIFIVIFYYFISRYEERLLIKSFGSGYLDYMKEVPMLLPLKILQKKKKMRLT